MGVLVCYHCLDDAVNGLRVYVDFALAQIHSHEVPPVDSRWRVCNLSQPCLFNVPRCRHNKYPDVLIASLFCCHFDAPAWVSSHVTVSDDHSKSECLGVGGCTQHFLGHVGDGAVDVGALTQITDFIDILGTQDKCDLLRLNYQSENHRVFARWSSVSILLYITGLYKLK